MPKREYELYRATTNRAFAHSALGAGRWCRLDAVALVLVYLVSRRIEAPSRLVAAVGEPVLKVARVYMAAGQSAPVELATRMLLALMKVGRAPAVMKVGREPAVACWRNKACECTHSSVTESLGLGVMSELRRLVLVCGLRDRSRLVGAAAAQGH